MLLRLSVRLENGLCRRNRYSGRTETTMDCIVAVAADEALASVLQKALSEDGLEVVLAQSVESAASLSGKLAFDMMLLDCQTCRMAGAEERKFLAGTFQHCKAPVLLLTCDGLFPSLPLFCPFHCPFHGEGIDRLSTPIGIPELKSRVQAVLNRKAGSDREADTRYLTLGHLALDLRTFQLRGPCQSVRLTPIEFKLLSFLITHNGEVISTEGLLESVWKYPPGTGGGEVVRWHIKNLRTKLRLCLGKPCEVVINVHRHGYTVSDEYAQDEDRHIDMPRLASSAWR